MIDFELPAQDSREFILSSGRPAVLYGMGNGADMVLDDFIRRGIPVAGVTASDEFVRGQVFRGYEVKKLSEFTGDFILAVCFGSGRKEVIDRIISLSHRYDLIFPVVPVYGDEIFDRDFVNRNEDKINSARELFSGRSRDVYDNCIRFMFSGRLPYLLDATSEKEEAFENILRLTGSESCLDLGAYTGDTVSEFLRYSGGSYRHITAVEADAKNFSRLVSNCSSLSNFTAINAAISDETGFVGFSGRAGRNSSLGGEKAVKALRTDDITDGAPFTYIKADIEGAEAAMLLTAKEILIKDKPKLNIALYHRSADIFELPLMIKSINPDYRFELRRHPYIPCWDMNLYCV